jgi:hypothetical protein
MSQTCSTSTWGIWLPLYCIYWLSQTDKMCSRIAFIEFPKQTKCATVTEDYTLQESIIISIQHNTSAQNVCCFTMLASVIACRIWVLHGYRYKHFLYSRIYNRR